MQDEGGEEVPADTEASVKAWADDVTRMVQEGDGEIARRFVRVPADMDTVAEVHMCTYSERRGGLCVTFVLFPPPFAPP